MLSHFMIDADYTDDLANTLTLLHSLEQAAGSIGFCINTN